MSKLEYIEELKTQLSFVDSIDEWTELYYRINQLEQEAAVEGV